MASIWVVTPAGRRDANGLEELYLDGFQNKNHVLRIIVNSGAAGKQRFSNKKTARPQNNELVPEGVYNLGPLQWGSGKKGDYKTLFKAVLSAIWQTIDPNRAIGFHLDGNRNIAPGSAGCLVFRNEEEMKLFVNASNGYGPFTQLIVHYGQGTTKLPDYVISMLGKLKGISRRTI